MKRESIAILSRALSPEFCNNQVKLQPKWLDYLLEGARSPEKPMLIAELYYTFYYLYDFLGNAECYSVVRKILDATEKVLVAVFENKIVTVSCFSVSNQFFVQVYPTAFMLIVRFFSYSDPKAFGIDGAPNLTQHIMLFFRESFLRIADPQTVFDERFLAQLRITTTFLITISKFQPNFVESVGLSLFVKAGQRVGQHFLACVEAEVKNEHIFECPDYINLLKTVTSIVRIVSPCIHSGSQVSVRPMA